MVLDQVHRELPGVLLNALADGILNVSLLAEYVAAVFLVGKDALQDCRMPAYDTLDVRDTVLFERIPDHPKALSGKVAFVYPADDLRLFGDDLRFPVLALFVSIQIVIPNIGFALSHGFPHSPANVRSHALALCLREGAHHCDEQFAVHLQRVDVLLLEDYGYAERLKHTGVADAVQRIARESGDRLDHDDVHLSLAAASDQAVELLALCRRSPADALVREDPRHRPVGIRHDLVGVVGFLRFVAGELLLIVGRHPAVCRDAKLTPCGTILCGLRVCRDYNHIWRNSVHGSPFLPVVCPFFSVMSTSPLGCIWISDPMSRSRSMLKFVFPTVCPIRCRMRIVS